MDIEMWRIYLEKHKVPKAVIDELEALTFMVEDTWSANDWRNWQDKSLAVGRRLENFAINFVLHSEKDVVT